MRSVDDEVLQGVEAIATHRTPVTRGYAFTVQVQAALDAGLAADRDPTWWATDIGARPSVGLTEEGLFIARGRGWTFTCSCRVCSKELLIADRREVRGAVFGSCCSGSARQYGVTAGSCGFHYKKALREARH